MPKYELRAPVPYPSDAPYVSDDADFFGRIGRTCDSWREPPRAVGVLPDVFFFRSQHLFLDFHVSELVRVEYLATIQTFDVFDVLFTRYDAHFGVFAGGVHLGGLSVQPVLLGKIVPAGFRLSNVILKFHRI
jgi:hypothetical protein